MLKKLSCCLICGGMALAIPLSAASSKQKKGTKPPDLAPVVYVRERSFEDLHQFGLEARAYTLPLLNHRIVIGLDFIRNLSGIADELPADLEDYVANAICQISPQFAFYRKYWGPVSIPGASFGAQMQSDPKVDFWISGSLQRASKVYEKDTNNSGDGTGGGGHTRWDAHAGRKGSRIIKSLTVTFTLEGPDRISIPGSSATYRIDYEQLQRGNTLSIYVAGSGLSFDKNITVTQNLDDALFDVTAASVIHLLGEAMLIPFDRCSKVFQHDPHLDKRLRVSLTQMTKGALEQTLKIWLFVGNYPVDESDLLHMTDNDRALVKAEMHHGSYPMTEDGVIDFAVSLWQDLDYAKGAPKVERVLAQIARDQAAQKEREEQAKIIEQRRQIEAQRAAEEKAKQDKLEQERKAAAEKAAAQKEERARAAKAALVIRQTSKRIRAKNTAPCGSKQTASRRR